MCESTRRIVGSSNVVCASDSVNYLSLYYLTESGFNPLTGTLKPQSSGPLYSNTVIGTLAVDGWAVTFGTAKRGLTGRAGAPPSPLLAVPNVTAHSSTANVPTSHYSTWHYNYYQCPLKG